MKFRKESLILVVLSLVNIILLLWSQNLIAIFGWIVVLMTLADMGVINQEYNVSGTKGVLEWLRFKK